MKTVRKGLKYFLSYLAVAAITAMGVILFTPSNPPASIRPSNPEIETSFITDAITNFTNNENYNITAEINIKQTGEEDIKILLDLNAHIEDSFSKFDTSGTATIILKGEILTIGLALIGSDLFLDIDGNKIHFTTNNIVEAIGFITELIGIKSIELPSFEGFEMSTIATLFNEYQEFDESGEKSVAFNIFGINVTIKLDKDHNITDIIIPSIKQGNVGVDFIASLNQLETNKVTTPDASGYKDGEYISQLLNYLTNLTENNFIEFITSINFSSNLNLFSQSIKLNTQVDLENFQTTITSDTFGDNLALTYSDNMIYTQFGGIKVKSSVQDLTKLFDLYQSVDSSLNNLDIPQINNALETADKYLDMLNVNIDVSSITMKQITEMVALVCSVEVYDNMFAIEIGDVSIYIMTSEDNISQIIISSNKFSITLSDIKTTGAMAPINKSGYIDFNEIYPTLKASVDTIGKLAFSGVLYVKNDIRNTEFNYIAKWQNGAPVIAVSTTFGGKLINITYSNEEFFVSVDQIKVRVQPQDINDIMELLSSAFNFEINLPDINTIKQLCPSDISVDFISEIKPLINGLNISFSNGSLITLICSGEELSNISFIANNFNACLSINTKDVVAPVVDTNQYIDYAVIVEQINKLIDLAQSENLKISGEFSFSTNDTPVLVELNTSINTKTYNSVSLLDITIDATTYSVALYYNDGVFYVEYDGYKVKISTQKIEQLINFITEKLPNYYNYSALLEPLNEYISIIQNPDELINNMPKDLNLQIELIEEYIEKIESISLDYNDNLILTLSAGGQIVVVEIGNNLIIKSADNFIEIERTETFYTLPQNISEYLNADNFIDLLDQIDATINSKTLALNATIEYDTYVIDALINIDFSDTLKINITSNSLGSDLSITYIDGTVYLIFGEVKISCTFDQLDEILDYAQNELFDTLTNMNLDVIDNLLTKITDALENTEELNVYEVYTSLREINFGDIISGSFKDTSFKLFTSQGRITDINIEAGDLNISMAITSGQTQILVPQNCIDWDDLFPTVKALVNTVANLMVSGTGQISTVYNGVTETFTFDYVISFSDNNLIVQISAELYGHSVLVTLQDNIVFVQLDDVKLQATYDDIKELMAYINEKFGTDIVIPDQLIDMAKRLSLDDINVNFIESFSANGNTLTINFDSNTMLQLKNQGGLISEIIFVANDISANLFISQVGGITLPNIDQSIRDTYLRYTQLTKYIDEVARLIEDFKNEEKDQYQFKGQIQIYEAGLDYATDANKAIINNGVPYGQQVYNDALSKVLLELNDFSFELFSPENLLLETLYINISGSGQGALYDEWVKYPQNFEAWYYSDSPNTETGAPGDGHLYLNTNGLKGQMNKLNIQQVFETVKTALPHYLDTSDFQEILDAVLFNDNHDMWVDLKLASSGMDEMGEEGFDVFGLVGQYAPLITRLAMDENGKISLDLDFGAILDNNWGDNIITIEIQFNGEKLQLDVYGLKVGEGIYMNLSGITVDTITSISKTPADPQSYMDFSTLANFLGEIDDTIQTSFNSAEQSYNLALASGSYITIDLNAYNIASCELKLTIQNAEFKMHSDGNFEAVINLTLPGRNVSLFGLIGVQNINEPDDANSNTTNHTVSLYITNQLEGRPMIYVDRTTTYKTGGFLGIGAKNKTAYIKARHDLGNMDVFALIQDICGLTDDILEQFRADVEYIDGPTKIEKVIKDYKYTQNGSNKEYRVDFDLQQLTLVKMMNPYDTSTYPTHFKATTSLKGDKYLLNNLYFDKIRINAKSGSLEAKVNIWGNIAFDQNRYGVAYNFNSMYSLNPESFGNIKYP